MKREKGREREQANEREIERGRGKVQSKKKLEVIKGELD